MQIFRGLTISLAFVFLSGFAHASALTYNSFCNLALNWFGPDPGTVPPISTSGTNAGSNTGCSNTVVTGPYSFNVAAGDVTASVSAGVITLLTGLHSIGPGTDNTPLVTSGSEFLEGTSDAGVQGTFTGEYVLTGSNIANDTVLIQFLENSYRFDCQRAGGGGCITVNLIRNGHTTSLDGYPSDDPSLNGFDFSQPFQISISFDADNFGGCCALDEGGSLDAVVTFAVSDANGNPVSVTLVSVPEPGSLALMCAGVGLFVLGRVRAPSRRTRGRIVALIH